MTTTPTHPALERLKARRLEEYKAQFQPKFDTEEEIRARRRFIASLNIEPWMLNE